MIGKVFWIHPFMDPGYGIGAWDQMMSMQPVPGWLRVEVKGFEGVESKQVCIECKGTREVNPVDGIFVPCPECSHEENKDG